MYRQVTLRALAQRHADDHGRDASDRATATCRAAWKNYLHKYNDGRGVVLIGHSQGCVRAAPADRQRDRPEPGGAQAAGLGDPARRQRDGQARAATSAATSSTSPPAARRDAARLRDRVLDLQRTRCRPNSLFGRPARSSARRPEPPATRCSARTRPRSAAARRRSTRSSRRRRSRRARRSAHRDRSVGVPQPRRRPTPWIEAHGAYSAHCCDGRRRARAADQPRPRRADPATRSPTRPGACTSSTRTSRSATSRTMSPARPSSGCRRRASRRRRARRARQPLQLSRE